MIPLGHVTGWWRNQKRWKMAKFSSFQGYIWAGLKAYFYIDLKQNLAVLYKIIGILI